MKVGDLVKSMQTHPGGAPAGALGLIISQEEGLYPRWVIHWFAGNEMAGGRRMRESTTYGHSLEVVSENG